MMIFVFTIGIYSTFFVYAQEPDRSKINEDFLFWFFISPIAAAIAATVAAIGLIFNALSHRQDANSRILLVIRDFANEIEKLEDSTDRNSSEHFDIFAKKYLNLHDRIAFLALKNKIPNDLVRYFKYSFQASLGILERNEYSSWKTEFNEYLIKWCTKQGIQPNKDALTPPTTGL